MKGQIIMSKKESNRVSVLERAGRKTITNRQGAQILGISSRQFRRVLSKYRENGLEGIIHKSRGKISNRSIPQTIKDHALKIIYQKYYDFGPTLAHEKLLKNHSVNMSVETLRKEMIKIGIWKPKTKKVPCHQMRERRFQEGELVQVDGSPHDWFEGRADRCTLLVYIDDATSKLLWLEFVESESTNSYFEATKKYLKTHGRPLSFYVDKHSVFRVNTTKLDSAGTDDSNGQTQFGRAMRELGIDMIFANSPQAKGRVERSNQTLQDRLVKELRLLGISSMEEGNKYLPEFMQQLNDMFAVSPKSNINAHRPVLKEQNLDEILCLKTSRVLSKNLELQYQNMTYQIQIDKGLEYTLRRTKVDVIEKLDGEITIEYKNKALKHKVIKTIQSTKEYDSKIVNKRVDEIKINQGQTYQFNLLGRTFLLWRKPDISILG